MKNTNENEKTVVMDSEQFLKAIHNFEKRANMFGMAVSLFSERKLNVLLPYELFRKWWEHYNFPDTMDEYESELKIQSILEKELGNDDIKVLDMPLFASFFVSLPKRKKFIPILEKYGFVFINGEITYEDISNLTKDYQIPQKVEYPSVSA